MEAALIPSFPPTVNLVVFLQVAYKVADVLRELIIDVLLSSCDIFAKSFLPASWGVKWKQIHLSS